MKMTLCSDIQAVSVTLNLNTFGNDHYRSAYVSSPIRV